MKKLGIFVFTIAGLSALAYYAYQHFLPDVVAHSITSDTEHSWMPFDGNTKIKRIKKPVNEIANAVIKKAHESNISIDDVLRAIDNAKEEQAYALLDELNSTEIESPDQVFTITKKHFPVDFDIEVFRPAFNEKVKIGHIKRGLKLANQYKDQQEIDAETAKSIAKKILLQKEEEFNKIVRSN
jgi:hypothetical protein